MTTSILLDVHLGGHTRTYASPRSYGTMDEISNHGGVFTSESNPDKVFHCFVPLLLIVHSVFVSLERFPLVRAFHEFILVIL